MAMTTLKGVGWISQARIQLDAATVSDWMSWTQWKERDVAVRHARKLLERPNTTATRVVRVDWTPGEEMKSDE